MGIIEIAGEKLPFAPYDKITGFFGITASQTHIRPGIQGNLEAIGDHPTAVVTDIQNDLTTPQAKNILEQFDYEKQRPYDRIGRLALRASLMGSLQNGAPVYSRWMGSHLLTHLEADSNLYGLLCEALPQVSPPEVTSDEPCFVTDVDMDRDIGLNEVIKVKPEDRSKVCYILREDRNVYIPAIIGEPEPTRFVTLLLHAVSFDNAGQPCLWEAATGWTGPKGKPLPVGKHTTAENALFWQDHALAIGWPERNGRKPQAYDANAVRYDWPYDIPRN